MVNRVEHSGFSDSVGSGQAIDRWRKFQVQGLEVFVVQKRKLLDVHENRGVRAEQPNSAGAFAVPKNKEYMWASI